MQTLKHPSTVNHDSLAHLPYVTVCKPQVVKELVLGLAFPYHKFTCVIVFWWRAAANLGAVAVITPFTPILVLQGTQIPPPSLREGFGLLCSTSQPQGVPSALPLGYLGENGDNLQQQEQAGATATPEHLLGRHSLLIKIHKWAGLRCRLISHDHAKGGGARL